MREAKLQGRLLEALAEVESGEAGFGAGVAVAKDGVPLAEAWFGEAAPGRPWRTDTPILTWSVSKGVAAMVVARLAQDGAIDLDAPIRSYWPDFGGPTCVTSLADVMTHRASLPWLPNGPGLPNFREAYSWTGEGAKTALARMQPVSDFEGKVAYHALTYGWLIDECLRRATGHGVDAQLQRLFARPHGLAMWFGTTDSDLRKRLAEPGVPAHGLEKCAAVDAAFKEPGNRLRRALCVPTGLSFLDVLRLTKTADFLAAETPAISLITNASSLARAYSLFATGDPSFITPEGRDAALRARAHTDDDRVTGGARTMALGFMLNSTPLNLMSPRPKSFGHPGMGGSLAWGDPETGLGFAYLTNAAIPDTVIDPRAKALSRIASELAGSSLAQ